MDPFMDALPGDQLIEDCQHLLTVLVTPLEPYADLQLIAMPPQHLIEKFAGHVDIPPQRLRRMAAQK